MTTQEILITPLLLRAEPSASKWLPTVRQLCEDRCVTLTTAQLENFAHIAGAVEQMYFDNCTYDPSTEEIELTVENFVRTCMPAKSWEAM